MRLIMTANLFMIGVMLWWCAGNAPLIALAATTPLAIIFEWYRRSKYSAGLV